MSAALKQAAEWTVMRSHLSHAVRMSPHVREADRRELWAGWRSRPEDSLRHGVERSSHCFTAFVNLQPICMVGVVPESLLGATGVVWLIGTDALEDHQLGFLRRCRPHLGKIRSMYSYLHNYVSAENAAALRWLKWLGFTVQPAQPFGPDGAAFHHFEVRDV